MKLKLIIILFLGCSGFFLQGQSPKAMEMAVNRSLDFLNNRLENSFNSYSLRELLHYILRNNPQLSTINKDQLLLFQPQFDDDRWMYPYYQRLHNAKHQVAIDSLKKEVQHATDISKLMLWAMYSDQLKKDSMVNKIFLEYTVGQPSVRQVAHAAIALKWVSDLWAMPKVDSIKYIINAYAPILVKGVEQEKPCTDSGMEGIVGLIVLNKSQEIKKSWIKQLLRKQQADGGWKMSDDAASSNDHSTILALWIINSWTMKTNKNPSFF